MELKAVIDGNAGATRALEYISGYEAGLALSKFLESTKLAKERFDLEMGKLREKYGRKPDRTKADEKEAVGFVCMPGCEKYDEFIEAREKLLKTPSGVEPVMIKSSMLKGQPIPGVFTMLLFPFIEDDEKKPEPAPAEAEPGVDKPRLIK